MTTITISITTIATITTITITITTATTTATHHHHYHHHHHHHDPEHILAKDRRGLPWITFAMAKDQIVMGGCIMASTLGKDIRGCIIAFQKLSRLEDELSIYMASPVVQMLPPCHQSEAAYILQDVQTTLRQAIDSNWTQAAESFANVDQLIENATKMSLWLKRMISSYNLHYSSYT